MGEGTIRQIGQRFRAGNLAETVRAIAESMQRGMRSDGHRTMGTEGTDEYVSALILHLLPEASHWVQQDAPAEVNEILGGAEALESKYAEEKADFTPNKVVLGKIVDIRRWMDASS